MKCYVFLGPPGVGKGTMAELFCRDSGFAHISTGESLREEIKRNSAAGRKVQHYIDTGQLVPDEVVAAMVSRRIGVLKADIPGFVLDGYPRTVPQAELLDGVLNENQLQLGVVILFEAEEGLLVRRLSTRRVCDSCGAVFNESTNPPRQPGVCEVCGGELRLRSDDQADTVRQRLQVYRQETEPLIEYYEQRDVLHRVPGGGAVEDNYAALREVI